MSTIMATVMTRSSSLTGTTTSSTTPLSLNTSIRGSAAPVPNKHLPTCPPGPRPAGRRLSSPTTLTSPAPFVETSSLLANPNDYLRLSCNPPVFGLDADQLHRALDHIASQPMPDPKAVFPWLHGLHPENSLQLAFFAARKKAVRKAPRALRAITVVKAGGDLRRSKIKGAISPDELLCPGKTSEEVQFIDPDPRDGFSVRNFQIQAAKLATVSDVVIYGDDTTSRDDVLQLAERVSRAQRAWRERDREQGVEHPNFSTFVLTDSFSELEKQHPDIVATDDEGNLTGNVLDFVHCERQEMHTMSAASEIAHNVWLGPTPDSELEDFTLNPADKYDALIECNEISRLPNRSHFATIETMMATRKSKIEMPQLEFPGSGSIMPPSWSSAEIDGLMLVLAWLYKQANPSPERPANSGAEYERKRKDSRASMSLLDSDGDTVMLSPSPEPSPSGRRFLIHCTDGYTETTLLALAYYMYANCVPLHKAYIDLHCKHKRNFFAYPTDVALLSTIQCRILGNSPQAKDRFSLAVCNPDTPDWMGKIDGSLPSRITDYMYLGNLTHANNPEMLRQLGIGQVLSVGETLEWSDKDRKAFCDGGQWEYDPSAPDPDGRWMSVCGVQDNGVDPLTDQFSDALAFIRKGRTAGHATLVHCRVGVSRSATICIAEVMNELNLSFPRAYCFVRARRLNVIIQPHLRFSYELLKFEEELANKRQRRQQERHHHHHCLRRQQQQQQRKTSKRHEGPDTVGQIPAVKRELEWATIAREIAAMNRPYSRQ